MFPLTTRNDPSCQGPPALLQLQCSITKPEVTLYISQPPDALFSKTHFDYCIKHKYFIGEQESGEEEEGVERA